MTLSVLARRRAAAFAQKRDALNDLVSALGHIANEHGGRFLLFGSAARGEAGPDSDVDLLLDFPDDSSTSLAWGKLERECRRLGLQADARPVRWCSKDFLEIVVPAARAIPGDPDGLR